MNNKALVLLFLLTCLEINAFSQDVSFVYNTEEEINSLSIETFYLKTILKSNTLTGSYISLSINYLEIDTKDALKFGGRGGWIFNHKLAIGLGGYFFLNGYKPNPELGDAFQYRFSSEGFLCGIFIEPFFRQYKKLHVSTPFTLGAGVISYIGEDLYSSYISSSVEDSDGFFYIESGIEFDINPLQYLRLSFGLYYRLTTNIYLEGENEDNELVSLVEDNPLNGISLGIAFKVGKF